MKAPPKDHGAVSWEWSGNTLDPEWFCGISILALNVFPLDSINAQDKCMSTLVKPLLLWVAFFLIGVPAPNLYWKRRKRTRCGLYYYLVGGQPFGDTSKSECNYCCKNIYNKNTQGSRSTTNQERKKDIYLRWMCPDFSNQKTTREAVLMSTRR